MKGSLDESEDSESIEEKNVISDVLAPDTIFKVNVSNWKIKSWRGRFYG